MGNNNKVSYLNGYLTGLSCLCSGLNFVPQYGAEIVPEVSEDIKESLAAHLSPDKITSYEVLPNWQKSFKEHIKELVTTHLEVADWAHYLDLLEDEILSDISSDLIVTYFKSEGEKYEYTNEGYLFHDSKALFMLYFWWSD